MGVEAGGDDEELGPEILKPRQDSLREGGAERLTGALTMVSCSPDSPTAPVPGKSGIWWVEQYITVLSAQKISCEPLP